MECLTRGEQPIFDGFGSWRAEKDFEQSRSIDHDHARSRSARTASAGLTEGVVSVRLRNRARNSSIVGRSAHLTNLAEQVIGPRHARQSRTRLEPAMQCVRDIADLDHRSHVKSIDHVHHRSTHYLARFIGPRRKRSAHRYRAWPAILRYRTLDDPGFSSGLTCSFMGGLRRSTPLNQFDLRVMAGSRGQTFVARQQWCVERLGQRDIGGVVGR